MPSSSFRVQWTTAVDSSDQQHHQLWLLSRLSEWNSQNYCQHQSGDQEDRADAGADAIYKCKLISFNLPLWSVFCNLHHFKLYSCVVKVWFKLYWECGWRMENMRRIILSFENHWLMVRICSDHSESWNNIFSVVHSHLQTIFSIRFCSNLIRKPSNWSSFSSLS